MNELYMGIDIGTSGVRAALFDIEGNQISLYHKEYPMICTEKGMAELDPEVVFGSLVEVVKRCIEQSGTQGKGIEAIGLSTQMHSILAVDAEGKCLTNVFTWADIRSIKHAESIKEKFDYVQIYNSTGCRGHHPMFPLSKVLWMKNDMPDLYSRVYKFVSIKEYILFKLFGEYVIDITDASTTGFFNIHKFQWDENILDNVIGIDKAMFGQPVDCLHTLKNMKYEYAQEMGINPDIPVIVGSGDGMLANAGCGVVDDTSMSCTIGTSGALRIAVNKPLLDPQQRTWCYCFTRDTWVAGGAINNGGIVLKWLRDEYRQQYEYEMNAIGEKSVYKLFDRYASEVNAGSDGLLFLPFLTGERSPNWNANAKGTIHGLQLMHGKKHFIRAAMEGVMYRMFSVYEAVTQLNNNVKQIKANGGYINSDIWLQIQADIFDKDIAVAGVGEAAVLGAAYTGMAAVGAIKDLKQPLKEMEPQKVIKPSGNNKLIYKDAYKRFKDLYSSIY